MKVELHADDTWLTDRRYRRIYAVNNGYVIYTRGGNCLHECQAKYFKRWISKHKAMRVVHAAESQSANA